MGLLISKRKDKFMIQLQLYKNPEGYPNYTQNIVSMGSTYDVTPVNIDIRNGSILMEVDFNTLSQANYLSLDFGTTLLFAFIDNIKHHSGDRYQVDYTVDAFRSYINKATLGTQFIKRSPTVSNTVDPLLRGVNDNLKDIDIEKLTFPSAGVRRTLVVQVSVPSTSPEGTYLGHPLQPNPYLMYLVDYNANTWHTVDAITDLLGVITKNEKPINLVNIYSIPWYTKGTTTPLPLPLEISAGQVTEINGFYVLPVGSIDSDRPVRAINIPTPPQTLRRTPHSVQLLIPEAGIINIPDDILFDTRELFLRQDIDITTGASNYALAFASGGEWYLLPHSVRGASVSGVPIAYSPEQQLMAINQTNKTTSLIGDVAGVVMGGAQVVGGVLASPVTGGASLALALSGGVQAGSSLVSAFTRDDALKDSLNTHSNPPAYLGSALLTSFTNDIFMITTKVKDDNATQVNNLYGYPHERLSTLTVPTSGFIQTQECAISGLEIPEWAKQEINARFDMGLRVK